jgi:hypothetical protein
MADSAAHQTPVQMGTGDFFTKQNIVHPPPSDVKMGTTTPLQPSCAFMTMYIKNFTFTSINKGSNIFQHYSLNG